MKKVDFTKLGGFPFDQDTLDYLQTAYSELMPMLLADLPSGVPVILSGMALSSTSTDVTVANGYFFLNGEIYRCTGTTLPYSSLGSVNAIRLVTSTVPLTFNNGVTYPTIFTDKSATFSNVLGSFNSTNLNITTFRHWTEFVGPRAREANWQTVASSTAACAGNILYKLNWWNNTLHLRGTLTVSASGVGFPPTYLQLAVLSAPYVPVSANVPFQMLVRYHNNLFLDSQGNSYITHINAELRTTGSLNAAPIAPAAGITSYQVSFNTIIPLD